MSWVGSPALPLTRAPFFSSSGLVPSYVMDDAIAPFHGFHSLDRESSKTSSHLQFICAHYNSANEVGIMPPNPNIHGLMWEEGTGLIGWLWPLHLQP